jgi:hypothetical protein
VTPSERYVSLSIDLVEAEAKLLAAYDARATARTAWDAAVLDRVALYIELQRTEHELDLALAEVVELLRALMNVPA